ncbi:MAG: RimK family alpha-L-glutamate ligase [Caldilinea sp.]
MNIGILLDAHAPARISPIIAEMIRLLEEWGVSVKHLSPSTAAVDLAQLRADCDLYVFKKSGSRLALSLGGALHAIGARMLNPYPVTAMLRDKIIASRVLQAHDVPTPDAYIVNSSVQLEPLLAAGPLMVKPYDGSQGRGVRVIENSADLRAAALPDGLIFAQRYHRPQGRDYKIYCIGDQFFGVRRVWPVTTYAEKLGEPFTLTPEMRQIALRCGQAFGITLFGIDIVYSDGRPYVVDMSSFPGFKGVPNAALRLADYIYAVAKQVAHQPANRCAAGVSSGAFMPEVKHG